MSRAHMLYDNKPLESVSVTAVQWEMPWNCEQVFRYGSDAHRDGILVEGTVQNMSRFYIRDKTSAAQKWRYVVLHVTITKATKRKFDSSGKEIEPNFGETKKVSTGYLMSSYKTCMVGEADKLTPTEVNTSISVKELQNLTESKASAFKNCASFWWDETELEAVELHAGNHVRLRTKGRGPYIDSLSKLDQQSSMVSNYSGGDTTGASWTDKVMSHKQQEVDDNKQEGVDDDEWVG
ncbi:hypothetical protein QZH41_014835 [Actinostola sp. cb2023]|nr:hypothetical protein QZH41_014835 [Actinostola sp. cb2023]